MKRGTIDHPKLRALVAALPVRGRYEAVGVLESIWHFTALYAYRGDIGKHADAAIAEWIGWQGSPDSLIGALVKTGWLNAVDGPERLTVHDWHEHCDDSVKKRLSRESQKAPSVAAETGTCLSDGGECLDMSGHNQPRARAKGYRQESLNPNPGKEGDAGKPTQASQDAAGRFLALLQSAGTWSHRDSGPHAIAEIGRLIQSRGENRAIEEAEWYAANHARPFLPAMRCLRDLEKWGGIRDAIDKAAAAAPEHHDILPCIGEQDQSEPPPEYRYDPK